MEKKERKKENKNQNQMRGRQSIYFPYLIKSGNSWKTPISWNDDADMRTHANVSHYQYS